MRVMVCGGAGYIGSHMCKLLADVGHEVAVIDDFSTGHREAVRWGTLFEGSIADARFLQHTFATFQPEAVLHFAARSIVVESVTDPAAYYRNNVAATLTLLDQVRQTPDCLLIFSSSAAIFGVPRDHLINEAHPKAPINPYGQTKLIVEQVLADYWKAYGLPSVSFRYFNTAGADPGALIGEAHEPETHLIPKIFETVLGRDCQRVKVFGEDYDTPDGTCVRDYVHVNDLCRAHLKGIEFLRVHRNAHAFNLGNGDGFSVLQVLKAAEAICGRPVAHEFVGRRPGDPPRLVADASSARDVLGWEPQYTRLDDIMNTAWNWHRNRKRSGPLRDASGLAGTASRTVVRPVAS